MGSVQGARITASSLLRMRETHSTPKKKRGRPVKVQNEIFVEMWNAALANGSLQEVAGSLGMSVGSASVKACNLRKAGYDLPQFKRGRRKKTEQPQQ